MADVAALAVALLLTVFGTYRIVRGLRPPHRQCLWCNDVEWYEDGDRCAQ